MESKDQVLRSRLQARVQALLRPTALQRTKVASQVLPGHQGQGPHQRHQQVLVRLEVVCLSLRRLLQRQKLTALRHAQQLQLHVAPLLLALAELNTKLLGANAALRGGGVICWPRQRVEMCTLIDSR